MNKDVIYIEPEDDITDIINRIKSSKQKVVALVPPKKLGVMRSAVNIKLIAKTAKTEDKAAVIVTTDPSLMKLAAMSRLPVAKTLSSRPMLPSEFTERKKEEIEELEEAEASEAGEETDVPEEGSEAEPKEIEKKKEDIELDSEEVEAEDDGKKKKKKKNGLLQKIPNFDKYRKWIILGGVAGVLLIGFLIWGFGIAPRAEILVNVKTNGVNISENVTLVTDQSAVDVNSGKFLLEQIKYEEESEVEFDATGTKNDGEKAKGNVTFSVTFGADGGTKKVPAGTTFTLSGKKYTANEEKSVSWDGKASTCSNPSVSAGKINCTVKGTVAVTASEPGTSYNIGAQSSGTSSVSGVNVASSSAMAGGTDKNVKVVSESDINDAKNQLSNNSEAKEKLLSQIGDGVVKIESSYKAEAQDPVSSPKKGEVVEDGKKAKLTAKTIYTIYVVDRTAIDEYIKAYETGKISESDRIYSTGSPFFERFTDGDKGTYTAKFKTTIKVGPEISETTILERAKGKKVGEVKAVIKDISHNITDVTVNVNFPWVRGIPNDPNKVTIKMTVEE